MSEPKNEDIRVVVADDEEIVLSLVRDALEDEGYAVQTASCGEEALEIVADSGIDMIITDIRMPRMDGIELVKRIREKHSDVVVIFMTGYANLNSAKDAIKMGASEYIMKPFELSEIRLAVSNAADKIRRIASDKGTDQQQLDKLSNLSQMLYTVADRKSLATLSLQFAMMHCDARCGSILYWDKEQTVFRLISIDGEHSDDRWLEADPMIGALDATDPALLCRPFHFVGIEEHPLYKVSQDSRLSEFLLPQCIDKLECFTTVPIMRAKEPSGLITIGFADNDSKVSDADLTFLSITASQLALSLENIQLLEESQEAYSRLKELQDETIQLEKMASRGEMSAEIGHELNNFMGVIAGNVQLLGFHLQKQNYEQLDKYVAAISDNVEKVKRFTSNLMDLTPISGKKDIVCFNKILREVIDYLKPQKRYEGVKIVYAIPSEEIPFKADGVHIQQLLYNLFNNAADAMVDRDTKKITASLRAGEDNTFRLTIADTGAGIEPALLEKAFNEKFTTKKHGHGFGLLVCKRIIDSHNGKLNIESAPGEGTSIHVDFPLAVNEEAEVAGIPAPA